MGISCKIAEQIYKSLDDYAIDDLFDKEKYSALNKIRKDLIRKFSKEFILKRMTLKSYVEADGDQKNFCYIIERKLRGWGSILGSTNRKFGIYKEGNKYKATQVWDKNGNAKKAFSELKKSIASLLDAGKCKDYEAIEKNRLSPMFKSVLLSLYFEKDFIAINKSEDVDLFLQRLKIDFNKASYNTFEKKKALLLTVKNGMRGFKGKSNYYFVKFLYRFVKKGISSTSSFKVPEIDSNKIATVDWQYLKVHRSGIGCNNGNPRKLDYEQEYRNRKSIGECGEKAILRFEIIKLNKLGLKNLANKVKRVSEKDDSLGYDILSYDKNGKEIHIEVKTKSSKKEMLDFYMTDNEFTRMKNDNRYKVYYLFDIRSKNPKLHIVDKICLKNKFVKPVLYSIRVDVKRKEKNRN